MPILLIRVLVADRARCIAVLDTDAIVWSAYGAHDESMLSTFADDRELWIQCNWDDPHRAHLFCRSDEFSELLIRVEATSRPLIWVAETIAEAREIAGSANWPE